MKTFTLFLLVLSVLLSCNAFSIFSSSSNYFSEKKDEKRDKENYAKVKNIE